MSSRDRMILVALAVLAVLVVPYLLVISPKRDQASKLQTQITTVEGQLATARSQALSAEAARTTFAKSYTALVRLGEAVPTDDNTPSLIYELQSAASAAHVDFQTLTFNAGSSAASPAPSTPAPSGPSSAKPGSSATSPASGASLPPGASVGPAGFPVEPFTFTFQGNFFHLADFLGRLQRFVQVGNQLSVSGRLMTLNAISLGPSQSGFPQITATISATTYLLPASQGLLNGATPSGPSSSTTQAVSIPTTGASPPPAVVASPIR